MGSGAVEAVTSGGVGLPPSPFRGLRAFREADAEVFRGRRAESAEIAGIVGGARCVLLVGPVGCGKSSLAMAGVLPLRRTAGDLPLVLRPGLHRDLLSALAAGLMPLLEPALSAGEQTQRLPALTRMLAEDGLTGLMPSLLARHEAARLLVVLDQFEELLDCPAEQVDELAGVLFGADAPATLRVLGTLRSDFLEAVLAHPRLGPVAGGRVCVVGPLRREQLREVLTGGAVFETDLAERMLADTGDEPDAITRLGFALDLLWDRQEQGLLTHAAYEEIGGVGGALAEYAERAWAAQVRAGEAAEGLLARLVRMPCGNRGATRRMADRAELTEAEWSIAERLAATRLLAPGGQDGEVELAHEVLITGWGRLARLVAHQRSFVDWRETVRHDADRWRRGGRNAELLPGKSALAAAALWLPERAAEVDEGVHEYLELGQGRARDRRRRLLFWRSLLAVSLVLVLVAGVLAVHGWFRGQESAALAGSRVLTQFSQDSQRLDPALAIMTALAAHRIDPSPEARDQLLRLYLAHRDEHRLLSGPVGRITAFSASLNGRAVLARTDAGRAVLFTRSAGGAVLTTPLPPGNLRHALVSADGRRAAFVDEDGTAHWAHVRQGTDRPLSEAQYLPRAPARLPVPGDGQHLATLSPDGQLLAAVAEDRLVWWQLEPGKSGSVAKPPGVVSGLWLGPDNRTLLARTAENGLTAVDLTTGEERTVLASQPDQGFLVSGDRTALAVCRRAGERFELHRERIADSARLGRPYSLPQGADCASLAAVDATGARVVLRHGPSFVDLEQGALIATPRIPPELLDHAPVVLDNDGTPVLAGKSGNRISHAELRDAPPAPAPVDQALTPDGSALITLLPDGRLQRRPTGRDRDRVLAESPPRQLHRQHRLVLSRAGDLLAFRDSENSYLVLDGQTLREVNRITTLRPPAGRDPDPPHRYDFDSAGRLITFAGAQAQLWDPRTGREIARLDLSTQHIARESNPAADDLVLGVHPGEARIVLQRRTGDLHVSEAEVATGRSIDFQGKNPLPTPGEVQFENSGRYLALRFPGTGVELWHRDPAFRALGPFRVLAEAPRWHGRFLDDEGRYLFAANNAVRVYQIGAPGPVESYELGEPGAERFHQFLGSSQDGRTLLHAEPGGQPRALPLDPAVWRRELCRVIGNREFTWPEQNALPAPVPAGSPGCPSD